MAIVANLAIVGIVTSFMLKCLALVTKALASSSEVVLTTILGKYLFGYDITPITGVSVVRVARGVYK